VFSAPVVELLKGVAARLRSCLRNNDTVARMGGDEFALLLPRAKADTAMYLVKEGGKNSYRFYAKADSF